MPRSLAQRNYFNFIKGFITEASALTFPENASLDEENFDLLRNGTRRRRLGVDYEASFSYSTSFLNNQVEGKAVSRHIWNSVGNDGDLTFLVLQIGETLYIHNLSNSDSPSNDLVATIDLNLFQSPNAISVGNKPIDGATGKGKFFLVSPEIEPVFLRYDETGGTIDASTFLIKVRDFKGVDDSLAVDERPSSLSDAHNYNLLNQGWDNDKIDDLDSSEGVYPSNADVWYIAKDVDDDFDPELLVKQDFGTSAAAKGRFILNAFLDNRSAVSGISGLDEEPISDRPPSVTFFAGRVWLVLEDKVYFSQILENDTQINNYYSAADPTSEHQSDLVDTDGGVITIPDMGDGVSIDSTSDYILVTSPNGIWQIRAPASESFTALNFGVIKVSDVAVKSHTNVTIIEDVPALVTDGGIYIMGIEKIDGKLVPNNITTETIQSFYINISSAAKKNSTLTYDPANKRIYMFYNSDPSYDGSSDPNRYDACLIYDSVLQAFYKYTIAELAVDSPYIYGAFVTPTIKTSTNVVGVITSGGDNVITSGGDEVIVEESIALGAPSSLKLITVSVHDASNKKYTFSEFLNTNFLDWETEDSTGISYTSFMESGYELMNDVIRMKQAFYIHCFLERTETSFALNGAELGFDFPSSCILTTKWQWTSTSTAGRWTNPQQVYRFNHDFTPGDAGEDFDYSYDVIETKSKIRGKGKAVHFRFESEEGKDLRLIGWAVPYVANNRG